jgi:hypothetical protein
LVPTLSNEKFGSDFEGLKNKLRNKIYLFAYLLIEPLFLGPNAMIVWPS